MGFNWSKDQRAVIDTRNCSVLVSAAAGSGKTAVLVERLIGLLTDEKDPVDIDKLLVVTFTNVAAAEMRERIGRGIDKKLLEQPQNKAWQRQRLLLPYAQISTIHSLCLKLVREHFDVLDLDPSFRLGDEAELKLLKADVAADVMEISYASGNRDFRRFVEAYANGKSDQGIAEMVIRIYDFAQGMPWPEHWLRECANRYLCYSHNLTSAQAGEKSEEHPLFERAFYEEKCLLDKWQILLEEAKDKCLMENGPLGYLKVIDADKEKLTDMQKITDYDRLRAYLLDIQWMRLPRLGRDVSEDLKTEVGKLHSELKADVSNLTEDYFAQSRENVAAEMAYIKPWVQTLVDLVILFAQRYRQEKRERNMLDFSDLEHETLNLLACFSGDKDGNIEAVPTPVANELSAYYREIVCDEYQDSNQVQEMILKMLSGERFHRFNRFMVGDVKQSIYRFRMADAAIFMKKYNEYARYGSEAAQASKQVRIDLHQNFRSRAVVLESINFFFKKIMTKSLGGIDYDETAALVAGLEYPEADGENVSTDTEVLLIDTGKIDENEDLDDKSQQELTTIELEAKAVAAKIHALTDAVTGLKVYDGNSGYRTATYSDIVILLRTVSGWVEPFVSILGQENIPVSAELSAGFFDTPEIRTMTELLKVVDNPRQDIPLAAVLRSPIVGLRSEELALIRATASEQTFYDACLQYPSCGVGYEKLHHFLEMLEKFRDGAVYMTLAELIQTIYDVTGYDDYVQAMPNGNRRRANLELLMERADSFAKGSYSGLFHFVRYLGQLKENAIDFGEASVSEEGKGSVRILSIHKSKGLEYPIVILAGMGKKINFMDVSANMIMHASYGIGLDAVNLNNRKKLASVNKAFIAGEIKRDTLAEELRILYVAMTRAKEKLILIGSIGSKDVDEQLSKWRRKPEWLVTSATSYLDWIMPCLLETDAMEALMARRHLRFSYTEEGYAKLFKVSMVDAWQLMDREVQKTLDHYYYKKALLNRKSSDAVNVETEIGKRLLKDNCWSYPWQDILSVKGKYSVSELKKIGESDGEPLFDFWGQEETEKEPLFMKMSETDERTTTGSFRGTAYHRVLENLDFASLPDERDENWIWHQLKKMLINGHLSQDQYDKIYVRDIADMVFSDLGRRMGVAAASGKLWKEAQFVVGLPVSMIQKDLDSSDLAVVQGVIDAFFEEDGKLILVDYKTDRVPSLGGEEILRARYERQLLYYRYALEQMMQKKVTESCIYAFALKKVVPIEIQ